MATDFKKIEKKWQKRWAAGKVFEAEPAKKNKFFCAHPFPYPSGDLHIGHARTFSRGDIIARFKRLQGHNVLFPMGFHATGNRAVVMSKFVKEKDPKTLGILKNLYRVPEKDIKKLENPNEIVTLFSKRGVETLKLGGFSIDWRRVFTSIDSAFSKFIEWQFKTLKEKGYIIKASHPVVYCPTCESPITQADRDEGEDAIITEFSIWKYPMEDGIILPAATLRPETIFAITNMFINPKAKYVKATVGKETWILSEKAAKNLKEQKPEITNIKPIKTSEIIGKTFKNPITGEKLLVLPGDFVDPEHTTGVVASEPSDAPDDHIALEELKANPNKLKPYGLTSKDIENIKYKSLIKLDDYGDFPAVEITKTQNITKLSDPKLLTAKKEIYKLQFHKGVMKKIAGKFTGMPVSKAIEGVKKEYKSKMSKMYALSERVTCKDGTECFVKLLKDQWFLKYGDAKWKAQVKKQLDEMTVIPKIFKNGMYAALDWTDNKACARKSGLGTPLPWDKDWVIETLSDSTIYMSFYIIAKYINQKKLKTEQLIPEFFDYVLLGKGNAKKLKVPEKLANQIKTDFDYWYPVDWRNSGKDLVNNHLVYYLYNHIAIYPKPKWPKTISVNAYVKLEGEKMSKSKGRARTFVTAIEDFGADVVRTLATTTVTPEQDSDWRDEEAAAIQRWQARFYDTIVSIAKAKTRKETDLDKWLISKTTKAFKEAADNLELLETRNSGQALLYQIANDFKWYLRRNPSNAVPSSIKALASEWVVAMSVFMPHISEELWEKLGNKPFVSKAQWPKYDAKKIDKKAEQTEETLKKTIDDLQNILNIVKTKPKKLHLYVIPPELPKYKEMAPFLDAEYKLKTSVYAVNDSKKYDPENKAKKAKPGTPGIYLE